MRMQVTAVSALVALCGSLPLEARPRIVRARVVPTRVVVGVRAPILKVHVGGVIHVRRGHGQLDVEVSPERAKVYVDGQYRGRGDKRLVLPAGFHRVKVVLGDGREVEAETVHVDAGHTTRVHLDL